MKQESTAPPPFQIPEIAAIDEFIEFITENKENQLKSLLSYKFNNQQPLGYLVNQFADVLLKRLSIDKREFLEFFLKPFLQQSTLGELAVISANTDKYINEYLPDFEKSLEKLQQAGEIPPSMTAKEFFNTPQDGGQSPFYRCIYAIPDINKEYLKKKTTPINFKPPAVVYNSTDPFSRHIFDGTRKEDGEIRDIIVRKARKGRNGKGDIEELRATLQWFMKETSNTPALAVLDEESRRIYFATATLYAEGNEVIPLTQIGKLAGYKDYHLPRRKDAILKILRKASSFEMEINNAQEDEAYHRRTFGKVSRWRGQLIYYDYVENVEIRGQITTGIRILQTPICYHLAKFRNQITSLPVNAFILPPANTKEKTADSTIEPTQKKEMKRRGMKSNSNAAIIGEYLLGRIKAKGTSCIIKKEGIFERVVADTKQKRYAAKLKAIELFKDYVKKGIIISFTENEKDFTIERVKVKKKNS